MFKRLANEVELLTHLLVAATAGWLYGVIEALWIPTSTEHFKALPWVFSHFAYYHVVFASLMLTVGIALCASHFEWLPLYRKRYAALMLGSDLVLMLWLEDVSWFTTLWRVPHWNEWNMGWPYAGIPLGADLQTCHWIPGTYLLALAVCIVAYRIAGRYADKSYAKHYLDTRFVRV